MRIIKTVIKNKKARLIIATATAASMPLLALITAEIIPGAYKYICEAAKYSDISARYLGANVKMNNGDLVLFTAEKKDEQIKYTAELPKVEAEKVVYLSRNISEEEEDLSVFNNYSGVISEVTFDGSAGADFINLPMGGQVRNCTELSNEFVKEETKEKYGFAVDFYSDEPQVLIMHTHTTESYEISEKGYYDAEYTCRSFDPENSVVAVGRTIAEELSMAGISVIHDGTIHDAQYMGAYDRSLETTQKILKEFPSIKIILDIHRDAIEYNGERISAVTEIDGKKAAQVMIISAADDGTYNMPNYLENFHFACMFQQAIESRYPTLTRPILFQYCQYNQQLSTGSLLLEIGSHGNTIEQAIYTGKLIGKALSGMLSEHSLIEKEVMNTLPRFFLKRLR